MTINASAVVIAKSESQVEIGVLPILLERKKLIVDRINLLQGDEKFESLRDAINNLSDESDRLKLEKELTDLEAESQKWRKQSEELEKAQIQAKDEWQIELNKVEVFKLRSQVWLSLLERESVATIVGSLLLVIITASLLIAMFSGKATSEIINNSFLVILGYFFGQTVSRGLNKPSEQG